MSCNALGGMRRCNEKADVLCETLQILSLSLLLSLEDARRQGTRNRSIHLKMRIDFYRIFAKRLPAIVRKGKRGGQEKEGFNRQKVHCCFWIFGWKVEYFLLNILYAQYESGRLENVNSVLYNRNQLFPHNENRPVDSKHFTNTSCHNGGVRMINIAGNTGSSEVGTTFVESSSFFSFSFRAPELRKVRRDRTQADIVVGFTRR